MVFFHSPKDDDYNEYLTSPKAKLLLFVNSIYDQIIERSKTFHSDDYKSSLKTASVLHEYMDPRISKIFKIFLKGIRNIIMNTKITSY